MKSIAIHIHYVYGEYVIGRFPYATERHRVETVMYDGHGWERCVTETLMKLQDADYCWLSDLNDNPFLIVKNREFSHRECD